MGFFVICDSLQALPHSLSVRAGIVEFKLVEFKLVEFKLSPVLTLCLFDCLSEVVSVSGFVSRFLKAAALVFSSVRMLSVIHSFWLGYVPMLTVGVSSSMHLLMKPETAVVNYSVLFNESRNILQSELT
jgi:hypothetical protein